VTRTARGAASAGVNAAALVQAWAEWADAGCHVHPCRADGSKYPTSVLEGSHDIGEATGKHEWGYGRIRDGELPAITLDQFAEMVKAGAVDGFGVFCGPPSGQLEMLEVEGRAVELLAQVKEHAAAIGEHAVELLSRIGRGCVQRSPSVGKHFLYRVNGKARGNVKLARRPDSNAPDGVLVLAETRGAGGWFVAAPSGGRTHKSGKPYTIERGSPATIPTISEEERDTLYALFSMIDEMPPQPERAERPARERKEGDPPRVGDDFNARSTWEEILVGWKKGKHVGDRQHWTRPGKDKGTSATTHGDVLCCFSTSTKLPHFDHESGQGAVDKFGAYAWLHHDGDFGAATKMLASKGYGPPAEDTQALTHGLVKAATASPIAVPALEHATSVAGLTASFVGPPGTMTARLQIVGSDGNLLDVQDVKVSDQRRRAEAAGHAARLLGIDAVAVERALVGLAAKRCHPPAATSGAVTLSTCLVDWLERQDSEALPTRLEPFDLATGGGLPLGAVTLFAAPPGIGKTAIALQLGIGAMTHDPTVKCVWALGEMTRRAFSRRVAVVGATMVGHGALTNRDAKERTDHARRVALAVEKSFGNRLAVVDGEVSIERVSVAAKESGARLIVLDYLQRLTTTTASQDRTTEIETIARKALELAVSLDAAVVLLAATAKIGGPGIGADQLARGSGSPGFDAEFAYLGEAPPPNERGSRYPVKWRCRKARSEALVDIDLEFDGPTQTYLPVAAPEFAEFARFSPGAPR
jgi:hypothetical protein